MENVAGLFPLSGDKKQSLLLNFKETGHSDVSLFPRIKGSAFPFHDTLDNSPLGLVWKPPSSHRVVDLPINK